MKILGALLTLSALCLIALPAAAERWDSKTTKDQMTGETQIYVSSPTTRPVRGLGFPYQDVRAWLAVGCNASREWDYVGFREEPKLPDTEAKSGGYTTIPAPPQWHSQPKNPT